MAYYGLTGVMSLLQKTITIEIAQATSLGYGLKKSN